ALVGPHAYHLAIVAPRDGGHAQNFALDRGLREGRQTVRLAQTGNMIADVRQRAAQRRAGPFGRGGEGGFAVKGCKNGASHQGGAAESGQNRAAEPLHRYPAPVETAIAVDRKRSFMAEIDGLGYSLPTAGTQPTLVQVPSPNLAFAAAQAVSRATRDGRRG